MNDEINTRETEVVERLRRSYVGKGYEFIANPRGSELPGFLSNRSPDAIARSSTDNVVLEVRSSKADSGKSALVKFLATEVPKHEGWRFELVIDDQNNGRSDRNAEPTLSRIGDEISKVEKLASDGDLKLGIVAGWALLEALSRKLVFTEKSSTPMRYRPRSVIEGLVSDGFLDDEAGERLVEISQIRNQLVHGFTEVEVSPEDLNFLLRTLNELKETAIEDENEKTDRR
jgi:hypothetical protein